MRLTEDEFAALVEQAMAEIPEGFDRYLREVTIDVEPIPSRRDLESVGLTNSRHLLGLYHGVPLTARSVEHNARFPDRITIYQENIQRICRTRPQIVEQIRKTVLHEVGHHFGLDEDDLEELGYR